MSPFSSSVLANSNRLLSQLPARDYRRLLRSLEPVCFNARQNVYGLNSPVDSVYFPLNTVVSHLAEMTGGVSIHVSSVGPEGIVGLPAFVGSERSRFTAFALVTGQALRLAVKDFRLEMEQGSALYHLVQRYTGALLVQLAWQLGCREVHSIKQRVVDTLLKVRVSVGRAEFELTQESLCQLLGVRRAGISEVAGGLQRAGLIRYNRGKLTVLDELGLKASACECYRVLAAEYGGRTPGLARVS